MTRNLIGHDLAWLITMSRGRGDRQFAHRVGPGDRVCSNPVRAHGLHQASNEVMVSPAISRTRIREPPSVQPLTGILGPSPCRQFGRSSSLRSLQLVGLDIAPILAGAGILGLGVRAQNLVRDLIGSFFIILEDRVRLGDVAVINGTGGGGGNDYASAQSRYATTPDYFVWSQRWYHDVVQT